MVIEEITFYTFSTGHIIYGVTNCSLENKNGSLWLKVNLSESLLIDSEISSVEFLGITVDFKVSFICENRFIGQIKNIDSYAYSKNI